MRDKEHKDSWVEGNGNENFKNHPNNNHQMSDKMLFTM